jgi:hypothetical protein
MYILHRGLYLYQGLSLDGVYGYIIQVRCAVCRSFMITMDDRLVPADSIGTVCLESPQGTTRPSKLEGMKRLVLPPLSIWRDSGQWGARLCGGERSDA